MPWCTKGLVSTSRYTVCHRCQLPAALCRIYVVHQSFAFLFILACQTAFAMTRVMACHASEILLTGSTSFLNKHLLFLVEHFSAGATFHLGSNVPFSKRIVSQKGNFEEKKARRPQERSKQLSRLNWEGQRIWASFVCVCMATVACCDIGLTFRLCRINQEIEGA